jgi:hypothetical protein
MSCAEGYIAFRLNWLLERLVKDSIVKLLVCGPYLETIGEAQYNLPILPLQL